MSSDRLSAHFRRAELACRCGCGLYLRRPQLFGLAEKVRDKLDSLEVA